MGRSYSRTIRVTLGDVDAAQVIFCPTVYRWHEYNFSEWLAQNFRPLRDILSSHCGLPVAHSSAHYLTPLHQDDVITATSWISHTGTTSVGFTTEISRNNVVAATVETRHVWVQSLPEGNFSPVPLPQELLDAAGTAVR